MGKRMMMTVMLLAGMMRMYAQGVRVTYEHDDAKMNQITVMESGNGILTPPFYYNLLHSRYSKNAASKNKTLYRTIAGINLYNQKDEAEKIDSALVKRAAIEALNVADRSGGALDLAWQAEGGKLTKKLNEYLKHVEMIRTQGGTEEEYQYWMQYYNMYSSAIKITQQAYQPNAQRKREYLRIYEDVRKKDEMLVYYLVRLFNKGKVEQMLAQAYEKPPTDKAGIIRAAMSRWKGAGMTVIDKPITE